MSRKKLDRDRIKFVVPNPRYGPGKNYLHNYFKHSQPDDSSGWDRFFLKNLSERPMWYTEEQTESTKLDLIKHLNSTGYYNGTVSYTVTKKKKKAKVFYTVAPGEPLKIKELNYFSENKHIQFLLDSIMPYLSLRRGMPLDEQFLLPDQAKIIQVIQDAGYYQISKSNLDFYYTDTTGSAVVLNLHILPPYNATDFKQFHISAINIYSSERLGLQSEIKDTIIDDITYKSGNASQILKPSILKKYLQITKDSLYSLSDLQRTRNTLQNLGIYKSVTVLPELSENGDSVRYNLYLPKVNSQFIQLSFDGTYVTNKDQIAGNRLFDLRFAAEYRHRNLFKGAEQFSISIVPNVGFQLIQSKLYIPWGLNAQASIAFPRFIEVGFVKLARNLRLLSNKFYSDIKNGARTRIGFGNIYDRFFFKDELSIQREINFTLGYEFTQDNRKFFRFNPVGLDYLNFDLSNSFKTTAPLFLIKSFEDRLLAGFFLKQITADINNIHPNKNSSRVLLGFESSGIETSIINLFTKNAFLPRISQFIRVEADGRYTFKMSPSNRNSNEFGFRLTTGMALALDKNNTIPFIKQFYVGGPNSVRGWAVREIGPGIVRNLSADSSRFAFFQSGNFKLEFGSEYRFDIYSVMKGALFFDGGNVWLLKKDPLQPGGEFTSKFLSQLYLSTGVGIRFDFDYVLFRLDMGIKLRTPYKNENGTHNALDQPKQFNVSLGLPF